MELLLNTDLVLAETPVWDGRIKRWYFTDLFTGDILGYNNPNRILNRLGNTRREYARLKTDGGIQNVRLVTDDEVCKLLCNARTRATPAFADWYFDTLSPFSKMFNRRCCK